MRRTVRMCGLSTAALMHTQNGDLTHDRPICAKQEAITQHSGATTQRVVAPEGDDMTTKTTETDELELWSEAQTAEWLKVSAKTLKNWRSLRQGPTPTYIGRRPCYLQADVIGWVQEQRDQAEAWRLS